MKLSQLVYVSDSREAMTPESVEGIIKHCRRNNAERNITGLLLYSRGHFIQLLEGHQPVLASLFSTICKDARHHNVLPLVFGVCPARLFPRWQMGLLDKDAITELDRSGLQPFVTGIKREKQGEGILKLLKEFRCQLTSAIQTGVEPAYSI